MTDIFHEVEEDLRRERYQTLWKKYGNYVIGLAALIVLTVAGQQAWQAYDLSRRQDFSERFAAARQLAQSDPAQAEAAFTALIAEAPGGYAALSKLALADLIADQGREDEALALLQELAADADPLIAAPARLRLAWAQVEDLSRDELNALLGPLTAPDSAWRFAASEVLAYKELQSGNRAQAIAEYESLAANANAGDTLRQRANAIAQHLRANPEAGVDEPAPPAETAEEASAAEEAP